MTVIKVVGKLNADKTKVELERRCTSAVSGVLNDLPVLKGAVEKGLIKVTVQVTVKGKKDPWVLLSASDRQHGDIYGAMQRCVAGAVHFYDDINITQTPESESEGSLEPMTISGVPTLKELNLTIPTFNCLEGDDITTVEELEERTAEELLQVRNFGETRLKEVRAKLREFGKKLKGD